MSKLCPQKNYFKIAQKFNKFYEITFKIIMLMSVIAIFLKLDILINIFSILSLVILGILKYLVQYNQEKAETIRRKDFIDNSFGTKLHEKSSIEYYDNDEIEEGFYKMSINLFENVFFSSKVSQKMKSKALISSIIPGFIVLGFAIFGFFSSPIALPILQIFLSQLFLSKLVLINDYNKKIEIFFDQLKKIFNSSDLLRSQPEIISILIAYESNISNHKLFLDDKIFEKLNPKLTEEWNEIKKKYGI